MDSKDNIMVTGTKDMREIASGNVDFLASNEENVSKAKLQLRMFLLANAKKELETVVMLTDFLDEVIAKYREKAMDRLNDPETGLGEISFIMNDIMKAIDRSNETIRKVASDEKLLNLLCIDLSTNVNVDNRVADHNNILDTAISRNKVRDVIDVMTKMINNGGQLE